MRNNYGKLVKEIRNEHKLSQKALGKLIAIDPTRISAIETGKAYVTIAFLERMAKVLNYELKVEFLPKETK